MKFLRLIKKLLKRTSTKAQKPLSEEAYYESLFTKNPTWSKPDPNNDEKLRWNVVKTFVETGIQSIDKSNPIDILDLGCGRGWMTNLLSAYGNVTGIEPVKPVIEYAKKLFPHIEFMAGTSKTILETKKDSYDFVISSEVIEHVPTEEKDEFIQEIAALLKKNGFLILTTPRQEVQLEWNKHTATDQPIEEWISESELETLLANNQFKAVQLERVAMVPKQNLPPIDIYQIWLFQKIN